MPGSIQFSYPVMSGTLNQGNITISDDGGGYFQCNYNTVGSDVYKLFKPTNILFFSNSMTVTHKYNNDMLYVKYSTTKDSTRSAITADNIYLNKSIGDGIVITKKVDFTNKTCDLSNNGTNYYIDMTTIGPIPVNVSAADNNIQDPFSTTGATSITSIPLSSGSFITDEIVCDSGTTDSSRQDKISSYQGYVFQGFGWIMFAMLIQIGVLILIQKISILRFPVGTGVFDFYNPVFSIGNNVYNIVTILAFLMSMTFFLVYGFLGPTVNNSYWYYLVIAIVFLFSFISFLLWKVMYLTDF
jgi:hypothetical protein